MEFEEGMSTIAMPMDPIFGLDSNMGEYDHMFSVDALLDGDSDNFVFTGKDVSLASMNTLYCDQNLPNFVQETEAVEVNQGSYPSKSPWHESDSGVSESLSFVGSPVDSRAVDEIDQPLCTLASKIAFQQQNINMNGASDDLVAYLLGEENNDTLSASSIANKPRCADRPVRKCRAKKRVNINVETSDSEDSVQLEDAKSAEKHNPQTFLNFYNDPSSFGSRNQIKIVKVVKPSNSTADATADDIMKALDERSKKNAQQAKINREKKKAYIKSLEDDLASLKRENKDLVSENGKMLREMSSLEGEVEYLKSVLANASALSGLLKNISNVKEVKLSATITSRKRHADDHTYNLLESPPQKRSRQVKENLKKAGVCLHVSESEASLEFCAHCSTLAQKSHGRCSGK